MAKRTRKPSSAQRDPFAIATAKYLKSVGVLSKQAKLHGGKFISRSVLKKTKAFRFVEEQNYTTVKVNKKLAERAKAEGFQVVAGNRVIAPKDRRYREALKRGQVAGVVPTKSSTFEIVPIPGDIMDFAQLVEKMEEGNGLDNLKAPGEVFAFKLMDNWSYQTFRDTAHLLEYLRHYKGIFDHRGDVRSSGLTEDIGNIVLVRGRPGSIDLPQRKQRQRERQRNVDYRDGRARPKRGNYTASKDLPPNKLARRRREDAERQKRHRASKKSK